jgi:hypothetical protein
MNSGRLEPGFDIPRRRSEIQRLVVTIPEIAHVIIAMPG